MRRSDIRGAGCCAAALLAAVAAAQEPAVIRVSTRLVQVDVIVRNGKGPVAGLTRDDFTLLEKGKPQEIALFKVTDARASRAAAEALPAGVVSNRGTQTGEAVPNATVVLVDHLNTPAEAQIYGDKQLLRFLKSAPKGGRIAIYLLTEAKVQVLQNFTADLDRLQEAASQLTPDQTRMDTLLRTMAEVPARDRLVLSQQLEAAHAGNAAATAKALTAIAGTLAGLPGRKNLVWISSGFPIGILLPQSNNAMRYFTAELDAATRMLDDASVAVYPVDSRGLVVTTAAAGTGATRAGGRRGAGRGGGGNGAVTDPLIVDASNEIVTMNTVAQATGGRAFYNDNGISAAIREAVEDGEITYTLGFYPPAGTLDGAFHDLSVKVAKSGVDVRYRKGYFASDNPSVTERQLRDQLKEILHSPFDATGIGMTAEGEPDPAAPEIYKLTVKLNLNDLHIEHQAAEAAWTGSLAVAFRSESDRSPEVMYAVVPVKLSEAQYKAALKDGYTVRGSLNTRGAAGRIRVMIQDRTTGAAGSVWIPVAAD